MRLFASCFSATILGLLLCVFGQGQKKAQKQWRDFQKFIRSHEDRALDETLSQCDSLSLDDDLSMLTHVDTSSSRGSNSDKDMKRKRILFLTTARAFYLSTDRWSFHLFLGLQAQPEYDVLLWGVGFPGFASNETTSQNIMRWFQDPVFDVLVSTWNFHRTKLGEDFREPRAHGSYRTLELAKSHNQLPGKPLIAYFVHELETIRKKRGDIQDLLELEPQLLFVLVEQQMGTKKMVDVCGRIIDNNRKDDCEMHPELKSFITAHKRQSLVAYIPHAVHAGHYSSSSSLHKNESIKEHDVLLVGMIELNKYPLRATAQTCKKSYTNVISRYTHPGYMDDQEWPGALVGMCKMLVKKTLAQERAYIASMVKARMCIIGSRFHNVGYDNLCPRLAWSLRKYSEAMAAGCVVIGDVPSDLALAKHVPLRLSDQTVLDLSYSVERALDVYKSGEYNDVRDSARRLALQNYTYEAVVRRFFSPALEAYLQGERGILEATRSSVLVRSDECQEKSSSYTNTTTGLRLV